MRERRFKKHHFLKDLQILLLGLRNSSKQSYFEMIIFLVASFDDHTAWRLDIVSDT